MKKLVLKKKEENEFYQENIPEALSFTPHFLDHVIVNCIFHTDFLKKVRNTVELKIYKTKEKQFVANFLYEYFDRYKEAPKDHFYDLFKNYEDTIPPKIKERAFDLVGRLKHIENSNPKYVLDQLRQAIMHFKLEDVSVEFAQLIKAKKYDEAKAIMLAAMREPNNISQSYYEFLEDKTYIDKRAQGKNYDVRTMIPAVDKMIGGMNFTWLVTILGATKSGKTWVLMELAVAAVLQGYNVLFVSLEMTKDQCDDRFDQIIGFLGSKPNEVIETMSYSNNQWAKIKANIKTIYDIEEVKKSRKAIKKSGGHLWIVDKSGYKFNANDLNTTIDEIQEMSGLLFHVVITDYLGEMGTPDKKLTKKKEIIASNTTIIKSIAKERNQLHITAMQGNRQAMVAKVFKSELIADAIEPIQISDLVAAICQTEAEMKNNVYRWYIAEYRHGAKHVFATLLRDLERGQIALDKCPEYLIPKENKEDKSGDVEEY